MKLVMPVFVFMIVSLAFAAEQPSTPSPRKGSRYSIQQAAELVKDYKDSEVPAEIQKAANYLNYYRSWYQAVAPAPVGTFESLSPKSKDFITEIKQLAEKFVVAPEKMMPGASKLSPAGDSFYQRIIEHLKYSPAPTEPHIMGGFPSSK